MKLRVLYDSVSNNPWLDTISKIRQQKQKQLADMHAI